MTVRWLPIRHHWRWLFTPPLQVMHLPVHSPTTYLYIRLGPVTFTRFFPCSCRRPT